VIEEPASGRKENMRKRVRRYQSTQGEGRVGENGNRKTSNFQKQRPIVRGSLQSEKGALRLRDFQESWGIAQGGGAKKRDRKGTLNRRVQRGTTGTPAVDVTEAWGIKKKEIWCY